MFLFVVGGLHAQEGACDLSNFPGIDEYSLAYKELSWVFDHYELVDVSCELELSDSFKTELVDGSKFEHPMPGFCVVVTHDGVNKTTYQFWKTSDEPLESIREMLR
jgi:hypothetical protein